MTNGKNKRLGLSVGIFVAAGGAVPKGTPSFSGPTQALRPGLTYIAAPRLLYSWRLGHRSAGDFFWRYVAHLRLIIRSAATRWDRGSPLSRRDKFQTPVPRRPRRRRRTSTSTPTS